MDVGTEKVRRPGKVAQVRRHRKRHPDGAAEPRRGAASNGSRSPTPTSTGNAGPTSAKRSTRSPCTRNGPSCRRKRSPWNGSVWAPRTVTEDQRSTRRSARNRSRPKATSTSDDADTRRNSAARAAGFLSNFASPDRPPAQGLGSGSGFLRRPSLAPWSRHAGSTTTTVNRPTPMVLMHEHAVEGTRDPLLKGRRSPV